MTITAADDLPVPTGWRMLVEPIEVETVTKGGIVLADESKQYAEMANAVGTVLKQGSQCYQGAKFDGPWCAVGDHVLYARHVGQAVEWRLPDGRIKKYLLINDDDVRAVVADPKRIKSYL